MLAAEWLLMMLILSSYSQNHASLHSKKLTRVICANTKIDEEIRHFISYAKEANDLNNTGNWYLHTSNTESTGISCIVHKDNFYFPSLGRAFILYDDIVIILKDSPNKRYFRKTHDKRIFQMQKRPTPDSVSIPYLNICTNDQGNLLSIKSNIMSLSLSEASISHLAKKTNDAFDWVKKGEAEDIHVKQILPRVECSDRLLDKEIRYFLSQHPKTQDTLYWNISLTGQIYTRRNSEVTRCTISFEPHEPDFGEAYLQYGQDILVLKDKVDDSVFKFMPNNQRELSVVKNRTPKMSHHTLLDIWFTKQTVLQKRCEFDPLKR
jgi:hypothetical protein